MTAPAALPVPLPPIATDRSITARLPAEVADGLAVFWPGILDSADWPARARAFNAALAGFRGGADDAARLRTVCQCDLVTALLEQLGERDIATIESALLYRVAAHAGWRRAAERYFAGVPDDTPRAAMLTYPAIGAFVLHCLSLEAMERLA